MWKQKAVEGIIQSSKTALPNDSGNDGTNVVSGSEAQITSTLGTAILLPQLQIASLIPAD